MAEIRETLASVVLVGRMNPLIFQPEWLRKNQIIGEAEAEAAREGALEVIHQEVSILNLAAMKLVVEPGRFVVTATEEPLVLAKDFAEGCFSLLSHTPTSALGLNFTTTFRLDNRAAWHRLGDILLPKEPWTELLKAGEKDKADTHLGGMRSVTAERSVRPDEHLGYIRVIVEAVEGAHFDTKVTVNDHFQFDPKNPTSAGDAVDLLNDVWDISGKRAKQITESIIELANGV